MIFDVKTGKNFIRKERFIADGNKNNTPAAMNYSSLVSRDSVWIALTIAALNNSDVLACDIQTAYLTTDCRERVWMVVGTRFGYKDGKNMLARKALYGLKSYSIQGLPRRDCGCNGLSSEICRPRLMVTTSSKSGRLRVL